MDKNQALSNLEYLKSLAESGQRKPLLGGRIGLMWTGILIPALILHGLVSARIIAWPMEQIGLIWMVMGIAGGVLSAVLSRGMDKKQGAATAANQIETTVWVTSALLIFGIAISITVGTLFAGLPLVSYNFIMPFAFATSTMSLAVLARMTGETYIKTACWIAAGFAMLTAIFASRTEVYYLSALGVLLTGVIPSLIELRKEFSGGE